MGTCVLRAATIVLLIFVSACTSATIDSTATTTTSVNPTTSTDSTTTIAPTTTVDPSTTVEVEDSSDEDQETTLDLAEFVPDLTPVGYMAPRRSGPFAGEPREGTTSCEPWNQLGEFESIVSYSVAYVSLSGATAQVYLGELNDNEAEYDALVGTLASIDELCDSVEDDVGSLVTTQVSPLDVGTSAGVFLIGISGDRFSQLAVRRDNLIATAFVAQAPSSENKEILQLLYDALAQDGAG